MTKEELKEAAKVMEAYANGKEIQCNDNYLGFGKWVTTDNPSFNWDKYAYRIKPEPKYRPFNSQEECWNEMLKHQPIGYIKGKVQKNVVFITEISTNTHNELSFSLSISTSVYDAECLFSSYTFADGTPFGIKED